MSTEGVLHFGGLEFRYHVHLFHEMTAGRFWSADLLLSLEGLISGRRCGKRVLCVFEIVDAVVVDYGI